ncbi:hypothetical protein E2320_002224 [Naja naja]|nr:hypothetical protein E2320_002224 [Naja naja]
MSLAGSDHKYKAMMGLAPTVTSKRSSLCATAAPRNPHYYKSSVSKTVVLSAFRKGNFLPADLEGSVIASYNTATGAPRVAQCTFRLPLRLVCFPAQPSKTASQKLTIDTNKPTVSLITLFSDFADQIDEDQLNVLGFQLLAGSRITLLASKTSREYLIN